MERKSTIDSYQLSFPQGAADSYENYRAMVRPMFDMQRADEGEPFHGKASVYILADMVLSTASCTGAIYERNSETILNSAADDILVLIYKDVPFHYEIDAESVEVAPGEVAFFDLAQPLRVWARRVDNISLIVARRRLGPLVSAIHEVHGLVLRDGATRRLLVAHLERMLEIGPDIPADESQAISEATARLVAACLGSAKNRTVLNRNPGSVSLVELKEAIENQLNRHEFGPETLMQQFGVSRATLYRLFAPLGGVSAYITERRLRYALRVISDPASSKPRIKQLAYDLGYKQSTAFSRAFRKFFGVAPSEVRAYKSYPERSDALPWKLPKEIGLNIDPSASEGGSAE
jgi:AraC-like DNA-binding protein